MRLMQSNNRAAEDSRHYTIRGGLNFSTLNESVTKVRRSVQLSVFRCQFSVLNDSHFSSKLFFQLRERNLDHRRPAVRTAVGQIASEQVLDQFFDLEKTQWIVRFDGMTANGFGDHLFTEAHG